MTQRNRTVLGVLSAFVAVFLVTGLASAFFKKPNKNKGGDDKKNGKAAAYFEGKDILTGNKVSLDSLKGKVIVLNFWATWCGPCKNEIPDLIKLQETYKGKLVVIGASVDDGQGGVKSFAKDKKINYPVIMASSEMQKAYGGISSIPATFFIDQNGKIVDKMVGSASFDTFNNKVKDLVKKSPDMPEPDKPNPDNAAGDLKKFDFKGKDIFTGKNISLSSYKGKVIVVNFWATWCGPCVGEIPGFISLQKKYQGKVQFIGLSVDDSDGPVQKYAKKNKFNYPVIMSYSEVESAYGGISSIPATYIFDKNGNMVDKFVGSVDESAMEGKLKKLLK